METNRDNYKIKLTYYDLEGNIAIESVWADKEGEYYRIKNIPFFAPNIAYNDLVSIEEDDGELHFDELIKPSGHSTIQIFIFNIDDFEQVTTDIVSYNCDWEESHLKGYMSVDVPQGVNYSILRSYLLDKRAIGILDFKEACLANKN